MTTITPDVFNRLNIYEQNEIIIRVMEYIEQNNLPYEDGKLYETAVELIQDDKMPIRLKIVYHESILNVIIKH